MYLLAGNMFEVSNLRHTEAGGVVLGSEQVGDFLPPAFVLGVRCRRWCPARTASLYGLPRIRDYCYAGVTAVVPSAYAHTSVASAPSAHTGRLAVVSNTCRPSYLPTVLMAAAALDRLAVVSCAGVSGRQPVAADPLCLYQRDGCPLQAM